MKKSFAVLVLSVFLVTSTIAPKRSEALIGAGITALGLPSLGIASMVVGGALIVDGFWNMFKCRHQSCDGLESMGILIGLVPLDASTGLAAPKFNHLDSATGLKLGMTAIEISSYNEELDELNAVAQNITIDLAKLPNPSMADAHALWQQYKPALSDESFSAVTKISAAGIQAN